LYFCVRRQISSKFSHSTHRKRKGRQREEEDDAWKTEDRSAEAERREESEGKGLSAGGQSRWPQSHLPHLQGFQFRLLSYKEFHFSSCHSFFLLLFSQSHKKIEFWFLGTFEINPDYLVLLLWWLC